MKIEKSVLFNSIIFCRSLLNLNYSYELLFVLCFRQLFNWRIHRKCCWCDPSPLPFFFSFKLHIVSRKVDASRVDTPLTLGTLNPPLNPPPNQPVGCNHWFCPTYKSPWIITHTMCRILHNILRRYQVGWRIKSK